MVSPGTTYLLSALAESLSTVARLVGVVVPDVLVVVFVLTLALLSSTCAVFFNVAPSRVTTPLITIFGIVKAVDLVLLICFSTSAFVNV